MKRTLSGPAVMACLATLTVAVIFAYLAGLQESIADETPISYDQLMSRVRLIPIDKKAQQFYEEGAERTCQELGSPALVLTAKRREFDHWKTHKDDVLEFAYPDDPNITLEVKGPKDEIRVMGQPVRSEGYTFSDAYRLVLGRATYCLLMVERADSFDDSVCFCGAIAFDKYMFLNGSLYRFSLLQDGEIKKIQALGQGVRVVLLEWTHLPMSQEVYAKIALSIRLKHPISDRAKVVRRVSDAYGGFGFLERGMSRTQAVELLGKPDVATDSALTYVRTKDRWRTTASVPLQNGVFEGFGCNWQKFEELPPERGSVDWILETSKTFKRADPAAPDAQTANRNASYIFERILELGPKADEYDWDSLCEAACHLHEAGYVDKRVLPIIRKRFLEPNSDPSWAAKLLHKYDAQDDRSLFAQKIRLILDEAKKPVDPELQQGEELDLDENVLHDLLNFLGESHPQRISFILEGMVHPRAGIRRLAYFCFEDPSFSEGIPSAKLRPLLLRGLEDTDLEVRRSASNAFALAVGSKSDIPILRKRASTEADEEVRYNLESAIERLEGQK